METLLSSFSKLEYLTIFGTFVYGYVATQSLLGWGTMISHRKTITFSTEHLTWTILTFMLLIDVWWGSWLKGFFISKHRFYFYLSLISPLIFYILSILQFPPLDKPDNRNLHQYFDRVKRLNFIVFVLLLLSFYLNDFFLQSAPLSDHIINSIVVLITIAALLIKNRKFSRIILIPGAVILILHIIMLKSFNSSQYIIENFSVTEYLTIFTAFIYGAVATKLFSGWGSLIYNARRLKISGQHLAWTIFFFALLMDLWWGQWKREPFIAQHIGYFLLSLTTPIVCYFLSVVIFPVIGDGPDTVDLTQFYSVNKKPIYILIGLILGTNCVISNVIEKEYIFSFTNILRAIAVLMGVAGMMINTKKFDYLLIVTAYGMLISHAFITD
jgi:hypothetical protein